MHLYTTKRRRNHNKCVWTSVVSSSEWKFVFFLFIVCNVKEPVSVRKFFDPPPDTHTPKTVHLSSFMWDSPVLKGQVCLLVEVWSGSSFDRFYFLYFLLRHRTFLISLKWPGEYKIQLCLWTISDVVIKIEQGMKRKCNVPTWGRRVWGGQWRNK